jgi:hypothetical protein
MSQFSISVALCSEIHFEILKLENGLAQASARKESPITEMLRTPTRFKSESSSNLRTLFKRRKNLALIPDRADNIGDV